MSENNEFENNDFFSGNNGFNYYGNNALRKKKRGWSFVSLVTGILSAVFWCLGVAAIAFGAVAVVAAFMAKKQDGIFDGFSISGLILGVAGIVLGAAVLVTVLSLGEEFFNSYSEEFFKAYTEAYPAE